MLLENVKVLRPKTTKIQRRNSTSYVYQVIEQTYNKDKKYTVDGRKCIGKMIDDEYMIPNEYFSQYYPDITVELPPNPFSDSLAIGTFLTVQKLFKDTGVEGILKNLFEDKYLFIEDLVSYMVVNETCTFQHYYNFMRKHPVVDSLRDDTQISRFLKNDIKEEMINKFVEEWCKLNISDDCIYIGYDSTNFNTHSDGIQLAEYGHPKVDEGLPQFNLSYAVEQKTTNPLFFELYEGSINDTSQLSPMVQTAKSYGFNKIGFLLDRGYISEKNLKSMRKNGYHYIIMLKNNQAICKELHKQYSTSLKALEGYFIDDHKNYGLTVKHMFYGKEDYFHIFYDDKKASEEKVLLLSKYALWEKELKVLLDKKTTTKTSLTKYKKVFTLRYDENGYFINYRRKSEEIKKQLDSRGYFIILTSQEMETEAALSLYRGRDNIEKLFRSLKTGIDFDKARVHTEESLKSKVFLTFIAMILRNELFNKAEQLRKQSKKEYTVPSMISQLETIECTKDSLGNYRRKYALTAKQKQILGCVGIDEKYIDKCISKFHY